MGNFDRNNSGSGKRKFDEREEKNRIILRSDLTGRPSLTQKILLGIFLVAAILFFISSYGYTVSVEFFFQGVWQGILIIIAILLVSAAVWDRQDRIDQRKKKKWLMIKLAKQKKILRKRFGVQKDSAASSQSSLNFAADYEEKSKEDKIENAPVPKALVEKPFSETEKPEFSEFKSSQTNLARILIEGEDISTFPPEWQEFFVENEGKEPVEKLDIMLKNGKI